MFVLFFTIPRALTTTGINVGFRCHIHSILISRSLYFDIFPNSPDDKFSSMWNSWTSKQELFLWSLTVISCLLMSISLSVFIANPKGLWHFLFQQQVLVYVHASFYGMGICNVGRPSNVCLDLLCHACFYIQ